MSESFRVYDGLLTDADYTLVRENSIACGFSTWTAPSSVLGVTKFKGVGYMGRHDIILRAIAGRLGIQPYPREMKFRMTGDEADPAYIHADGASGVMSAILYLSDDKNPKSGTGFYKHVESGLHECPDYSQMNDEMGARLKADMVGENPESTDKWDLTGFVASVPNRLLLLKSSLFHSRLPRSGIGDNDNSGRLIWVGHLC